jgi:hypothetical protein
MRKQVELGASSRSTLRKLIKGGQEQQPASLLPTTGKVKGQNCIVIIRK